MQPSVPAGQACEVVVFSGKHILRREVRSSDMYASIDEVEDKLGRTMRKFKERREAKKGKVAPVDSSVFLDVSDESEDEMTDTFAPSASAEIASLMPNIDGLVKRKAFPVPLQTVEEAILCLEYVLVFACVFFRKCVLLAPRIYALTGCVLCGCCFPTFSQVYRSLLLPLQVERNR